MSYINTTESLGSERRLYNSKALSQEARILLYFAGRPADFTAMPSEVWANVFAGVCPLTSVRRAMTCLTADRSLDKCDTQGKGFYGRPEFYWKLHREPTQFRLI